MKSFGMLVLAAGIILGALWFGGFIGGSADMSLTDKGRDTYNRGVGTAQDGLDHLKLKDTPAKGK